MLEQVLKRLNPAWVMLLVSGLVLLSIWFGNSYRVLAALRANLQDTRQHNQQLESKVMGMQKRIQAFKSDPRALEREARDQLLLSKEDELIFLFESEKADK